jgi:hypothetical protein
MPLKGDLRDFSTSQLLNLISVARKTGTLIVESRSDSYLVCFREGKLAYAQAGRSDNGLAAVLAQAKKITPAQYKTLHEKAAGMSDKELGLLLINANYITQQDILTSLQNYFISIIHKLFDLPEGAFRFEGGLQPPESKITLRINLENLIIEGTRRQRELEHLQDELPSLDVALKFSERPGANIQELHLSQDEWRVVRFVSPKNTLRQIAAAAGLNELQLRRIVFSLLQAGVVEIIRPPASSPQDRGPVPADASGSAQKAARNPAEQRSLINRLINRIRSL